MRRAVVAGSTGTIGRALTGRLRDEGRQVTAVSRTAAVEPPWPAADVTFLCIGAGGLDACERDPVGTRRVNVDAVVAVARVAAAVGSRVVLVSSSHVFDGRSPMSRAGDPRSPQTAYGRQKADAEAAVLEMPGAAVLRLSKVIGPGDARLGAWREALLAGRTVEAFADLAMAPVSLADAVTALVGVGEAGESGVFQLSGSRKESYLSLALAVADHLGAPRSLVVATSAADAGVPPAFRPSGVLLEQTLPRPLAAAGLSEIVAQAFR